MYTIESLHPQYYEERAAAEGAKRLAEEQKAAASEMQNKAPAATEQATPAHLPKAYQAPPLSRTGSNTVLGGIFQNLMMKRTQSSPGSIPTLKTSPLSVEEQKKMEAELLLAEKKRDADICAYPGWH